MILSWGTKLHTRIPRGDGQVTPMVQAGFTYDFAGDEATATGQYTGGGATFVMEGANVQQVGGRPAQG